MPLLPSRYLTACAAAMLVTVTATVPVTRSWAAEDPDLDLNRITQEPLPGRRPSGHPVPSRRSTAAQSAPATQSTPLSLLSADCPAGYVRTKTLLSDGFERGSLPETKDSIGWSATSSGGAASGSYYATSKLAPAAGRAYHALFMPVVQNPIGRTVLRFSIRGSYSAESALVAINDAGGRMQRSPRWGGVTLDITGAATGSTGEFDVRFLNYPKQPSGEVSQVDIDDVQVYRCTAVSATGVRGDFTGDSRADLISVDTDGDLWVFPGQANGTLGEAIRAGRGWGSMTWLGSPGDLTGDKRADLLGRSRNGDLICYPGKGGGAFETATVIGRRWSAVTGFVLPGDMTGDRRADLITRDARGTLRRYTLAAARISGGKMIGRGFAAMRHLVSTGDLDGNGRGDLITVRPDGRMVLYPTTRNGNLRQAVRLGTGWASVTSLVSPGDLNGDGREDLLAALPNGVLRVYLGTRTGVRAGPTSPSGWRDFRLFG